MELEVKDREIREIESARGVLLLASMSSIVLKNMSLEEKPQNLRPQFMLIPRLQP